MDQAGHRYKHPEAVWPAPCGCAVALGLVDTAYRFCPTHALTTDHAPGPTSQHIRWLWQTHAAELAAFCAAHVRPVATDE